MMGILLGSHQSAVMVQTCEQAAREDAEQVLRSLSASPQPLLERVMME